MTDSGEGDLVQVTTEHADNSSRSPGQQSSVNDIADSELLGRAVRNCRRGRGRGKSPLWAVAADRFALGSTYATQLCRRYGLDPDEMVKVSGTVER